MTTIVQIPISTEERYQQAALFYTQSGMLHTLRRQWEFLKEPAQRDFVIRSILLTAGTVTYCTYKGLQVGEDIAKLFDLKDEKKQIVILCGGSGGFLTGVGLSFTGNAFFIESSQRIKKWKEMQINNISEKVMREEFENDPIWSEFNCPIMNTPMYIPTRTPGGQAFDYNSLAEVAERNGGVIKDIYNKSIPMPTKTNPQGTKTISYSLDACLPDAEMTIVIYKRFRHLATQKCQEKDLSIRTKELLISYRNALGDFVKVLYLEGQEKINKKRFSVVMEDEVTEVEAEKAELVYNKEMATFKELFGETALSNIDWEVKRDWTEILNKRWMKQHHS